MTEELREVLISDQEANRLSHSLTVGNQRGLVYHVTQVKPSKKRIERAIKVTHRTKNGIISPRTILK